MKTINSRAPLRIGLAGGGTDVSPYSDLFGGAILNATIDLFAHAVIIPKQNGKINLRARDLGESIECVSSTALTLDGNLDLLKGVYNRIVRDFDLEPLSFELITHVDVPKGSGLGASSTITVAVIGAFVEWLDLPMGEYDIASMAYNIERKDLAMSGGKQDQYAATFGGVNYMEFYEDKVIVNPLRIKESYLNELESNLLLYYTGVSRHSSAIIEEQSAEFQNSKGSSIEAAHVLKKQAGQMKEALLTGRLDQIGAILHEGWQQKKKMANKITNPEIDEIYRIALEAGAIGGKISGAGGGGFMTLYCPQTTRFDVISALSEFGGHFERFHLSKAGLSSWK